MAENVYKVIELIGTSTESWEKATAAAINRGSRQTRRATEERQGRSLSIANQRVVQVREQGLSELARRFGEYGRKTVSRAGP